MDGRLKPVRARDKRRSFFYDQLPPPGSGPMFHAGDEPQPPAGGRVSTPSAAAAAAAVAEAAAQASEAGAASTRGSVSSAGGALGSGVHLLPRAGAGPRGSVAFDLPGGAIASSASAAQAAAAAVASLQIEAAAERDGPMRPTLKHMQSLAKLPIGGAEASSGSGERHWTAGGGEGGRRLARAALAATAAASLGSMRRGKRDSIGGRSSKTGSILSGKDEGEKEDVVGRRRHSSLGSSDNVKGGGSDDEEEPTDSAAFENQGQLGTDFMRNVPSVVGIPVYGVATGVTFGSFVGLLLLSFFTFHVFTSWYDANILSQDIPLPRTGLDASLHLRNCAVQFHRLSDDDIAAGRGSFLRMSAWLGFQERSHRARSGEEAESHYRPWTWRSPHELMIRLRISSYDPWFRCSIRFYLAENFEFNSLDILFLPADNYVNLDANIPVIVKERLSLDAFHAFIRFHSIEAKSISLSLIEGHLEFLLDGVPSHYSNQPISINSRTASVSVQSRSPLSISMDADAAARSLLRASGRISVSTPSGITSHMADTAPGSNGQSKEEGNGGGSSVFSTESSPTVHALLYPSDASLVFAGMMAIPITFDCEQCAFYGTARTLSESLEETSMETWVGQVHSAQPHLIPYAEEKVSSALRWVMGDPSAPWVINVEPTGLPEAAGLWRVLSSNAYLNTVNWFVILSGGTLTPRTLHVPLQIMGLFCRSVIDVDENDVVADVITSAEDYIAGSASHYFTRKRQGDAGSTGSRRGFGRPYQSGGDDSATPKTAAEYMWAAFGGTSNAAGGAQVEQTGRRLQAVPEEGEVNGGGPDQPAPEATAESQGRPERGKAGAHRPSYPPGSRDKYRYQLLQSRQKLYGEYYAVKKQNENKLREAAAEAANPFAAGSWSPSLLHADDVGPSKLGQHSRQASRSILGYEDDGWNVKNKTDHGIYPYLYRPSSLPTVASSSLLDLGDKERAFIQDATPAPVRMLLAKDSAYPGTSVGPTKPLTMCINEVIEDTFLVLWNAFNDTRTPSTLYVWTKEYGGTEYLYSVLSDALVKTRVGVRDTWYFMVAIVINLVATFVLGALAVYAVYAHFIPRLKEQDREAVVLRDASHRLDHEISGSTSAADAESSWNVMVSRVHYPCHGLLLRWSAPEGLGSFVRLGVHIRPADVAWAEAANDTTALLKYAKKEVYIYLNASSVQTVHQLGLNQKELFLPIRHPGMVELDTAQSFKLDTEIKYRVRLVRFTSHGRALDQSRWSPEIILGGGMTFTDYPILVIKRLLPSSVSSLDIFLRKFTYVASHFSIPVTLTNIKLQLFDMPPEAKARHLGRLGSGALTRFRRSSLVGDDTETVKRWGSDVENVLESITCNYTASAHFGYKAQVAKDIRTRTGRRIYSEVRFQGHPTVVEPDRQDSGDQRPYLELSATNKNLRLLKDRIAHNTIGFEVVAGVTGQVLAYGTIRFEDLYQIVRETVRNQTAEEERKEENGDVAQERAKTAGRFRVGLEYVDGGGPWGRLECSLDIENIRSYIRHFDKEETAEPVPQRRRMRMRTTIQTIKPRHPDETDGDASTAPLAHADTPPTQGGRRGRLSRVEGTSQDILAQLGLLEGSDPSDTTHSDRDSATRNSTGVIEMTSPVLRDGRKKGRLSTRLEIPGDSEGLQVPLLSAAESSPTASPTARMSRVSGKRVSLMTSATTIGRDSLPYFVRDSPGRPLLQGADLFVQWVWPDSAAHPEHVFLCLFRHEDDKYISALHWGRPIPNTGSYAWSVDTSFERGQQCQLVYIAMFTSPLEPPYDASGAVCESNAFYIVRPTPLAELELIYASFCRTHGLEMEHMSEAALHRHGFDVREHMLKICEDLRAPLCTEAQRAEAVHCPGQCLISTQSKLVMLDRASDDVHGAAAAEEKQVVVYKSVTRKVRLIENFGVVRDVDWWTSSPDILLLNNDLLYSSALLQHSRSLLSHLRFFSPFSGRIYTPSASQWLIESESSAPWTVARRFEFQLLTSLINVWIICIQCIVYFAFPVFVLAFTAIHNYSLTVTTRSLQKQKNEHYFSDVIFEADIKSLMRLPPGNRLIIIFTFLYMCVMTVAIFFNVFLRQRFPRALRMLDIAGRVLVTFSIFSTAWALSAFVFWFLLGALVNSDSFLPYAAMVGSVVFVVGYLWMNFLSSRDGVTKFIEDNMQLLLSLALDHWFANMNITYTGKEQVAADEILVTYRDRIHDELRDGRMRLQREYQLGHLDQVDESVEGSASRLYGDHTRIKQRKDKLAIPVFDKYTAAADQSFYFDDRGQPHGLENIPNLPEGARFATVSEVGRHSEKIDDMLSGWDSALLKDGVKYGPRFGYKVEHSPQPGQSYSYAIVALPRYPPPDELDDVLKTQMVFDYFNKEGKDYLTSTEFIAFLKKLRDSQAEEQNWPELCAYFNDIANTNIDPNRGITVNDLLKIYSLQSGELDRDYEKLYPIIRQDDLDEDLEDLERLSDDDEINGQSEEDVSEYDETTEDEDEEEDAADAEGDDAGGSKTVSQEEERVKLELKTNLNARKLQYIYNYATQENRGPAIDELISSVPFLASKILETNILLLSPVFGKEAILGLTSGSSQRLSRIGTAAAGLGSLEEERLSAAAKKDERFVTMMKVIQLEFAQELSRQFRLVHTAMFDNHNVRAGVQDFYDNVIPQQVSTKASRLLNQSLELSRADVYPTNAELLAALPPKTASQLLRAIQKYRIEKDQELKQVLTYIWKSQGALQIQLQVHLVCKTLLDLQLLTEDDFLANTIEVPTEGGQTREFRALCPKEPACLKLITEAIDKQLGGRLRRMTSTTHLVQVLRHIVDRNLWFECFIFLVQLMGNDIYVDELPGGAVGVDDFTGPFGYLFVDQIGGPDEFEGIDDPTQQRYRRNLLRIRAVFDQLSNFAGFLPLDLVDEAIQLLTDNRLNFSGVVACLQHLKIGSVYIEDSGDLVNTFDHLGVRRDSPVCDIEASSETVNEVIDWTSFRKDPGWTPDLFRAFDRLTSSCPGYMGKSQMFEFVKEIHKLFQPQVSEMRRGRDRLRGRKQEQKGGITQLGGVSREQAIRQMGTDGDITAALLPADVTVDAADETMRMVSFEMFHKVASKLGLSVSHRHSRILWIILSLDSYEEMQQFLPERDVKLGLIRIYLQPLVGSGRPATNRDDVAEITGYKGYVTFVLFRRILRQLGVVISDKSARILWDDIPKDPLDVTDFLPPSLLNETCPTKYLRIEMDKVGMDPMKGRVASIDVIKKKLPRMLMTGLWPEAIRVLLKLSLQLDVPESHITSVLSSMDRRANRYGLIRPEEVGAILSNLSVEGMTFSMLRDVIQKMRVVMPDQDIKRMFDLMDINQDLTLSLGELLSGFEVLFGRLMPALVLKQVGLSNERMLIILCCATLGLLAFFGFLGLAFSSFESLKSGISTAVQSLLAVLGAVGLQSSASQEMEQVQERMKTHIEAIMGDQLSKAKEQVEELQEYIKPEPPSKEGKPTKLRYIVPRKFRPDLEDPRPCVTFTPGSYVRLDPTVSGRVDRDKLRWTITPRIPKKTGLTFNPLTGIIEGTIPFHEEHMGSFHMPAGADKRPLKVSPSMRSDYMENDVPSDEKDVHHDDVMRLPSHHPSFGDKVIRLARRTYTVVVRNSAGYARTRVTFQIQHRGFLARQQHKKEATKDPGAETRRDLRKRQTVRLAEAET
ncbi:EF hand domain-containing protein [Besnoitia besnoiti]|uniref:EF hand domain-containing protein n=1 Tax=Besnoitia besnoiti TaxID=94643 RepID=A0A2A9MGP8_BESBE|nr:EF hand domain-containing protein [Besnoitia besnoiti]PFH34767.1 EF hand domain-containing protein [Besnoitia besnoiti]